MALRVYTEILAKRQVQVVVGAGLVAGLAAGAPLAIVLMVQRETGSFAEAGAVAAALAVSAAVTGPVQGRLVDRFGQSRTLPPTALAGAVAAAGLVAATLAGAPLVVLIAIAALAGASSISVFPSMRVLWADLVDHPGQLGTAYAIHAVMTEIFFIAGPLAAAALIALGSPAAAVLAISGARLLGVLALAATPASRAWRGKARRVGRAGALASRGMRTMLTADLPFGAMFGILDVAVPGFAKAEGQPAAAGLVLAALAVGSMLGGLAYGARQRPLSGSRYALICGFQALLVLPLAFAGSIAYLAVAMAVAGLMVAPLSTVAFGLVDVVAPAGTATEAASWILTAYLVGLALGTAAAGVIVEGPGTTVAFLAAFACASLSAAILWTRRASLAPQGA